MSEAGSKVVKAGLDIGLSSVIPGAGSVLDVIEWLLDPGKSKQLDAAITAHLLSEVPRIKRLLEARMDCIEASGCTVVEAQIVAYQVVQHQKQTLDDEKRRLLTNVLINGLTVDTWDKARHRLIIRLVSELEPEHIKLLKGFANPPTWQDRAPEVAMRRAARGPDVGEALTWELIARGLLTETTETKTERERQENVSDPPVIKKVSLTHKLRLSDVGREFLVYLRDPEAEQPEPAS